jgi:hypothetical protein
MFFEGCDIFLLPASKRPADHTPYRIELWISRAKPIVASSVASSVAIQPSTASTLPNYLAQHLFLMPLIHQFQLRPRHSEND